MVDRLGTAKGQWGMRRKAQVELKVEQHRSFIHPSIQRLLIAPGRPRAGDVEVKRTNKHGRGPNSLTLWKRMGNNISLEKRAPPERVTSGQHGLPTRSMSTEGESRPASSEGPTAFPLVLLPSRLPGAPTSASLSWGEDSAVRPGIEGEHVA